MSDNSRGVGRPSTTRDAALEVALARAQTRRIIPSAKTIAAELGMSQGSVGNAIRALAEAGVLAYDEAAGVYYLPEGAA